MPDPPGPWEVARRLGLPLALALLAAACAPAPSGPNVVLVSIDTLRADALGAYGSPVPTPHLDRLAREGVVFENAFATAPVTAPSHASLFTGREVVRHGVLGNAVPLPEEAETLAEAFRAHGYRTGAVVSSFILDARFGWRQGFEHFDAEFPAEEVSWPKHAVPGDLWKEHSFDAFDRRAGRTTEAALRWMEERAEEPFFLFVHYFDPHAPYVPPASHAGRVPAGAFDLTGRRAPGLSRAQLAEQVRLYHAEVQYVDAEVGRLVEALDRRSSRPRLVVVTADHGEGLGQHGWMTHSAPLYDEQLRVPLVFHGLGLEPRRLHAPVSLVDVAPTVAALAGAGPLGDVDGRSLVDALRSGVEPAPGTIFAYRRPVELHPPRFRGEHEVARTDRWKYIRSGGQPDELFDLVADRGETRNLRRRHPDVAAELAARLDALRDPAPDVAAPPPAPDAETRRGLEALGYLDEGAE